MKARELLQKYPMAFLVWNLNEDTNVFWSDLSTLEENGDGTLIDPWGQKINLRLSKHRKNSVGDVVQYELISEFQGYPVELVILNE